PASVFELTGNGGVERAAHEAASQTTDSETRRFFGCEGDQLDGAARLKSAPLQGPNRFESAEHADRAVVTAGIRNGIDMRPRRNGGNVRIHAVPAAEGIPDSVLPNYEPDLAAQTLHESARTKIRLREDNTGRNGRRCLGNSAKCFKFPGNPIVV